MQRRSTIPVPLFIGVVIGFYGAASSAMAQVSVNRGDDYIHQIMRWFTFNFGCGVAEALLITVALFAVAKRAVGTPRVLVTISAWVALSVFAWYVLQYPVAAAVGGERGYDIHSYGWKVLNTVSIGSMAVLTVAARAWTRPSWVTVFAVLGLLAAIASSWTPLLGEWLFGKLGDGTFIKVYWPIREGLVGASLIVLVHAILRDTPPATPDPHLAATAFRRAHLALMLRIVAAVALAVLALGLVRSGGGIKMLVVLGPAITLLTTLVFAWSMLDVERAALDDMPRVRLVIGAGLLAWTAGIGVRQTAATYAQLSRESNFEQPDQWMVVAPIVGIVGVMFVVSAIYSFAISRGDERLRSAASARAPIYAILSLAPTLLPLAIKGAGTRSSLVGMGLITILCAIAAIVVLAGLMSRAAEALGRAPALPEARLRR